MPVKLTKSQRDYIEENFRDQSPSDLARSIGKPTSYVNEYLKDRDSKPKIVQKKDLPEVLASNEPLPDYACPELRAKHEFQSLHQELTPREMIFFEKSYRDLIEQFQGDVLPTEEKQISQAIKLEVFMRRNEKIRLQCKNDLDDIDDQISDQECLPKASQNDQLLGTLRDQRRSLMISTPMLAKEWNDYQDKHGKLMQSIRGTRDQRVKQIVDAKSNILGLLKEFQKREYREQQAKTEAVRKLALAEEYKRLSAPHTYMDGMVDRPILNHNTIEEDSNGES